VAFGNGFGSEEIRAAHWRERSLGSGYKEVFICGPPP
jgi:hypothetical protein